MSSESPGPCQIAHRILLNPTDAQHATGTPNCRSAQWMACPGRETGAPGAGPGPEAGEERETPRKRPREPAGEESEGGLHHGQVAARRGAGASGVEGRRSWTPGSTQGPRRRPKRRAREVLGLGRAAQSLTGAVARLCMLGVAAALRPPPDAPDPRPHFSTEAAKDDEPPQPPSAFGSLRPFAALWPFTPDPLQTTYSRLLALSKVCPLPLKIQDLKDICHLLVPASPGRYPERGAWTPTLLRRPAKGGKKSWKDK